MDSNICAFQMLRAYAAVVLGNLFPYTDLAAHQLVHEELVSRRLRKGK